MRFVEIGAICISRVSRHLRSTSYSRAKPKPPWVCKQASAACQEASAASSFAMLASGPQGSAWSNSEAARRTIKFAASVSAKARDSGNCTPWFWPIGQNQGVQFPLSRAFAETEAANLMVRRAASLFDQAEPCGPEANMAKLLAADASWHAAEACLQTHGGFGFAREYDVERKWRETRLFQVAPISTNLVLAYLAEHVLGLPRSY